MKKIISLALCGMAVLAANAQQETVNQAKKLAGKVDKIEEARSLIQQALQNPETQNKAETYYVAGKIEWDAYDKNKASQMVDPSKVDPYKMGEELVNGYNYFVQVFPLDNEVNDKGEMKQKYTKELQGKIPKKHEDFFNTGALLLDNKDHFPMAYQALMIYGDMPELAVLGDKKPEIKDTTRSRAWAYYYAGRAAYGANNLKDAINAFKKAREQKFVTYDQNFPSSHLFEIASWQALEAEDPSVEEEAKAQILEIARDGYNVYGVAVPLFLTNIVDGLTHQGKADEALTFINDAISKSPEVPDFYSVRAWLYDNMGKDDESVADYLKAVSFPNANYEITRAAVRKLFVTGQEKMNNIDLSAPDGKAQREAIKTQYLMKAKDLINAAQAKGQDTSDLNYFNENIDYLLGQ